LRKLCGAAGGYAGIGETTPIESLALFLDKLEQEGLLPKTILYTLNPAINESLAVLTGSFAEDGITGKIQFGPAWWLNDHFMGISQHLETLANYSLLSCFIGMTTDSRSVLSFSRHEYFRRILCNKIGEWAETGFIPNDSSLLKELIENIAYRNIKKYLKKRYK
jgi:glucuronate isomerase